MKNPLNNIHLKRQIWKYFFRYQLSLNEIAFLYQQYLKNPLAK